ncbi:uncharacterized protein PGTG_10365 [Puccinia graminis f. sp. tritici CRL 75-36-700-3]|uniref:Uncharacterized protein n=1 Tax=Puccinia graminis f. sp. tritici (strain CRL 75-36-700-3 / race SCCL) TaxID=418459 RepID=E3KKR9_PUCGT|nr:uncharacterized protein PGTG_10365 [Puccinia graminis f. sp. tritici CRL 75-36-700-3]EFP84894.1 hypothetical protein PGTG_10365 [Puccinia graminis f. sp. tritici CRL 75-36-700-3]
MNLTILRSVTGRRKRMGGANTNTPEWKSLNREPSCDTRQGAETDIVDNDWHLPAPAFRLGVRSPARHAATGDKQSLTDMSLGPAAINTAEELPAC